MLWIILPPIILIVSLSGFIFFLRRKKSNLKGSDIAKAKSFDEPRLSPTSRPIVSKSVWQRLAEVLANVWEGLLNKLRSLAKSSEKTISRRLSKIRGEEKPGLEKEPFYHRDDISDNEGFSSGSSIADLEDHEIRPMQENEGIKSGMSAVTKKAQEADVVTSNKHQFQPEDKKLEEALIYRIAEDPKDVEAYKEIGEYYYATGNIKDAKDSFKMVLKLRPRDLRAKSRLRDIEMMIRLAR
jgi:tetratricopeptide (TPR) repeat protein